MIEGMNENKIVVSLGQSINEALQSLPDDSNPVIVQLEKGTYIEKVFINRPNVTLLGAGRDETRISYDDASRTIKDGKELGTAASASVTVTAPYFAARELTLANDFDYPSYRYLVEQNPGKVKGLQAVALRTTGEAMKTSLYECRICGYQDTLYLDAGVHTLEKCIIEGNVDFIFGAGTALFTSCLIVSNGAGYVVAPSTRETDIGFCFNQCKFLSTDTVADETVYLGRPWHPKADPGINSFALLYDCFLDRHIQLDGWTWMHAFPREGGEVIFSSEDSRFYETLCHGPGSMKGRYELDEKEAIAILHTFEEDL